jgi:hypothetical protein
LCKRSEAAAGQFLFLTFHEAKDGAFNSMSASLKDFKKSSKKKIITFDAKVSDPANKDIVAKYGIPTSGDLPIVLVFAPNGVITGGFPKQITTQQLKQSVEISDLMMKIMKPLQEQKVTLVALQNKSTKLNNESWNGVNEFSNDPIHSKQAASSALSMMESGITTPLVEATVVVLLPPGQIGKILAGKVTKTDLIAALQACAGGSCCPPKK